MTNPVPTPPETDPDAKPELGHGGGVGGPVPMRAAAAMSNEEVGRELSRHSATGMHDYRTLGALARKLCAQPAPSSLPAGLVVRDHRVVAGGWASEPKAMFYARRTSGHVAGIFYTSDWDKEQAFCSGWCHADDFQRAMCDNTPVPWVTRTAPRVEWLPWVEGRPEGKWVQQYEIGERVHDEDSLSASALTHGNIVAYWPDPNAGLLDRLTAAILAGEVAP